MVLVAQPPFVVADDLGGMDADRGHDGRYRRKNLEQTRLKAAERILRLTDPVHPEQVSMRAFDVTWSLLQAPGCPQSDQLASDYGGWDRFRKRCLEGAAPPRPPRLPEVPCDRQDAIIALSVVRAHVAAEQGIEDLEQPVVVLGADYDRIRRLLAERPRGRDREVLVLPNRPRVIAALEADGFPDALRRAGLAVEPPTRPEDAISFAEALLLAVEHRHALPTSAELEVFCRVHRIARTTSRRPPWKDTVAEARRLAVERGIDLPDEPPALDDRPPWHEPVEALGDQGGARQWTREAILEACEGFLPWLTSPVGPADGKVSDDNLREWLSLEPGRPSIDAVRNHVGPLQEVTAALVDRYLAQTADQQPDDAAEQPAASADSGDQSKLEALLAERGGPTLPALLRFAAVNAEFTVADLRFLGVSDGHLNGLLRELDEADAILMRPPRAGKAIRYRLARPLSERAQRHIDQAPDLDDPFWVLRESGRSKTDHLLAAYDLAAQMPPGFTVQQFADRIDKSYGTASQLLRRLQGYGSITRSKDPDYKPSKQGDRAPWLHEVTGRPPHAVDRRRAPRFR
jgi:hypothetical protein